MNHSEGNYTFQKHACVPVCIDHLEVLLLPQLKYKQNKHTHKKFCLRLFFCTKPTWQEAFSTIHYAIHPKTILGTDQKLYAEDSV